MRRRADTLRLFVALYPPCEAAEALAAAGARVCAPGHRFLPPGQVHLTLVFIGDTPARELRPLVESIERGAAGIPAFALTPESLITLPTGPSPRLLAAQTDEPAALLELQKRLAQRLATRARGRDRFLPHLTLVRFDPQQRVAPVSLPMQAPPFAVAAVSLMQSLLKPGGAEHQEVARVALGGR